MENIEYHQNRIKYHQAELNRLEGILHLKSEETRKESIERAQTIRLNQWKRELVEIKNYINENYVADILELSDHLKTVLEIPYNQDKLRRNFLNYFRKSKDFLISKHGSHNKVQIRLTTYY